MKYVKKKVKAEQINEEFERTPGTVVPWQKGVIFKCPCGERQVYIASPPHTIEFDEEGILTVTASIGSKPDPSRDRKPNWCHFHIKGGVPEMCGDAKCPGSKSHPQL